MIDEKKMEEAADKYSDMYLDMEDEEQPSIGYAASEAFKTGINWFLDNLWHDASEEPKEGKTALVKAKVTYLNDSKGIEYIVALSVKDGKSIDWLSISAPDGCVCYEKISYVYIEDLLKGGKIWKK